MFPVESIYDAAADERLFPDLLRRIVDHFGAQAGFLGWMGGPGRGRALGCGEVKFTGQVTPDVKKVVYKIHLKRVINRRLVMGIADGVLEADGEVIYTAADMRVGLFGATKDGAETVGG